MFFKSNLSFLRAFINIAFLTVLLWTLVFLLLKLELFSRFVHPYIHTIMIYSWVVAILVAYFSHIISKIGGTSRYVTIILGSTALRMVLSIILLIILLLRDPEERLILIVNFFIVYLSYLLFEIYSIITNLRTFSKKDNNDGM